MSVFALEDGTVYHTYSAYIRGLDSLWGMYQWLDRAPKGRNENMVRGMGDLRGSDWLRRHDEYGKGSTEASLPRMTKHIIGTREQWLAARLKLLKAEKELMRRSDALAQRRRKLPWVRIDKPYRFQTEHGSASLKDLFGGRSQLLVYHSCSATDTG